MRVQVNQTIRFVEVRIMLHDDGGHLAARAERNLDSPLWPVKYTIVNNIFVPPTLTEATAADYSKLFALSEQALKVLKKNVKAPADFNRQWAARLTRKSVVISEAVTA